jgi:hypothetical protein
LGSTSSSTTGSVRFSIFSPFDSACRIPGSRSYRCLATTILAARRQLSWPVGAGLVVWGRGFRSKRGCRPSLRWLFIDRRSSRACGNCE